MLSVANALLVEDVHQYSDAAAKRKEDFHKAGKKLMKQIAEALNLAPGSFDIHSNKGGIAVSGEVTLHSDSLYLQASESCCSGAGIEIRYRSCKGRQDCCGGQNHFVNMRSIAQDKGERLIAALRHLSSGK